MHQDAWEGEGTLTTLWHKVRLGYANVTEQIKMRAYNKDFRYFINAVWEPL